MKNNELERINARLDSESQTKVRFILEQQSLTQTEMVKAALDLLYQQFKAEQRSSAKAIELSGFVAASEGPEDLSENYKAYLQDVAHEKHDNC